MWKSRDTATHLLFIAGKTTENVRARYNGACQQTPVMPENKKLVGAGSNAVFHAPFARFCARRRSRQQHAKITFRRNKHQPLLRVGEERQACHQQCRHP